ncbi:hypothetical protein BG011_007917 [Mortierella polycephala]|uniref:Uncharacterized protein n=1 Tax=Mortierella polycephala TaxID=41804 RepID=A0A9P6QDF5_9FUNG|nr:hypothetical protein BG011_007917 [Mortierella polycephala]
MKHPVIKNLEKTRQNLHEEPFPHPHAPPSTSTSTTVRSSAGVTTDSSPHPFEHAGTDVVDQILRQVETVHLDVPENETSKDESTVDKEGHEQESAQQMSPSVATPSSDNKEEHPIHRLSTTATMPSASWEPLASKSSNQLPSRTMVDSMYGSSSGTMHEYEHDKPSVLPEILPGFKDRLADIHHATLKSVSDVTGSGQAGTDVGNNNNNNRQGERAQWTGGTMYPAMTVFKNPVISSNRDNRNNFDDTKGRRSASADAHKRLSKSSILYESSDLPESTTSLSDDNDDQDRRAVSVSPSPSPSKTLVQGGQGGRRWSHELSPEKAGLVGSVLEVAGLVKDVVLDKVQQRPPTSGAPHKGPREHYGLSEEEKQEAAKVAFGGAEETGDQTIYLEGLQDHLRHEAARSAAASTTKLEAKDLLGSAPNVGQEHQKSIFHLAGNPETKKSFLLDHPESLGYHVRDPTLTPFEDSTLVAQHRLAGNNTIEQQDISKSTR